MGQRQTGFSDRLPSSPRIRSALWLGAVERQLDQTVLIREASRLGPVGHVELPVDVREVELHGLLRDPELLRDRLVREPARERLQDRRLALGEAGRLDGVVLRTLLG